MKFTPEVFKKLPTTSEVTATADKGVTWVCRFAFFKRVPAMLGSIVLWLGVVWLTSGVEDRVDMTGTVDYFENSGVLAKETIHTVVPSRSVYPGKVKSGSATMNCEPTKVIVNGNIINKQQCNCANVIVSYVDDAGNTNDVDSGPRSGGCPAGNAYVAVQNGKRVSSFGGKPSVQCKINDSINTKSYSMKCPLVGKQIDMVKQKDGKNVLPHGNWNKAKLRIKYMDPSGISRVQTISKHLNTPIETRFAIGQEIPVYYSEKHKKIYLEDWNGESTVSTVRVIFGMLVLVQTVNCLSFLNYYACRMRLGAQAFRKMEDTLGFEV